MIAVGLMSGTSLDGIDVALLRIHPAGNTYTIEPLAARTVPFGAVLEEQLRAALPPNEPAPRAVAEIDAALGLAFGRAAADIAAGVTVDYVSSHGLTLYHDGTARASVQVGDPFVIREIVGSSVVSDYRRADCAAGGQGAPLVPYVDALLLGSAERYRIALNLGGITNATLLAPSAAAADVRAWDIGPGNMLLDGFVRQRTGGRERLDRDGRYAARGAVDEAAVAALLADEYFAQEPPKSTGRERFGEPFLARYAESLDRLSLEDGCATLAAVTVRSIAAALRDVTPPDAEIVAAGGGARNRVLLAALRDALAPRSVIPVDACGIDADYKEAIAFAVLGYELLRGRPAGLPRVTGALHAALLGSIAPAGLAGLLERIQQEVRVAEAATRTP